MCGDSDPCGDLHPYVAPTFVTSRSYPLSSAPVPTAGASSVVEYYRGCAKIVASGKNHHGVHPTAQQRSGQGSDHQPGRCGGQLT